MKRIFAMMLIGIVTVFFVGQVCLAKEAKDMQIVYIVKDLVNPAFVEMKWGGFAAAKKYGVNYNCLAPEKYTVDNQIRIMEDLIQKRVDGIIIVPIDGKGIVSGIERANKAGVPVLNSNTLAVGGDVISFVGRDDILCGKLVAQFTVDKLKENESTKKAQKSSYWKEPRVLLPHGTGLTAS